MKPLFKAAENYNREENTLNYAWTRGNWDEVAVLLREQDYSALNKKFL